MRYHYLLDVSLRIDLVRGLLHLKVIVVIGGDELYNNNE